MRTQASKTPTTEERDPPNTFDELRETPIRPGDLAVPFTGSTWYYVLRRSPTPAGAFEVAEGGTLADTAGCDADTDVVVGVEADEVHETPGVESFKDLRQAVEDGRLCEVALPTSAVVVAVEEFVDAKRAGDWSGLLDYCEEASA